MKIEAGKVYVRNDSLLTGKLITVPSSVPLFLDPSFGTYYNSDGTFNSTSLNTFLSHIFNSKDTHTFLSHEFIEVVKHKYWLITYRQESTNGGKMYINKILDNVHPFVFMANQDKDYDWLLWQFQEITEDEFQLNLNILNGSKQLHGIPIFYLKPEDSIKDNVITFKSKWSNKF